MNEIKGLTSEEVLRSREVYGSNVIAEQKPDSFFKQFLAGFKDPMIQILSVIAVIMLVLFFTGFGEWYEPVGTIVAILLVNLVTAKTGVSNDKAYRKLKNSMEKETAKVMRNGQIEVVCVDDLVVGDKILLQMGDKILADGILISGKLSVENSVLNGEMEEVHKEEAPEGFELPDEITGDTFVDKHSLFRGAIVLAGEGFMEVQKVGEKSMMGKMSKEMQTKEPDSPLQVKLHKLAKQISIFGYIGSVVIALSYAGLKIYHAGGWATFWALPGGEIFSQLISAVVIAITIIICAVPEGLPLVIALVLMQNTGKLYKANVLVRKSIGIETAGSLNILFSDKTGTITKGQLEVIDFMLGNGESYAVKEKKDSLILKELNRNIGKTTAAIFDSEHKVVGGNITDHALANYIGEEAFNSVQNIEVGQKQDFSSARKFSQAYLPELGRTYYKGAPERLLEKAKYYLNEKGEKVPIDLVQVNAKIDSLARKAFRILSFGYCEGPMTEDVIGDNLVVVGLVCIRDDVRLEVKDAIAEVKAAGVQVVMITGDRKETAVAIGIDSGLYDPETDMALTSAELGAMSDDEIKKNIKKIRVIARALPTDKSRMVRICQELNLVVGMTGDGVNDSPALKLADVGFAMGSGTEVAKEASKLVVLDDNFLSIKNAIWYGRTLYINILKFCKMQLVINIAAVLVSAICPFLGIEAPLKVTHLLWINLCMDSLASIMYATEPALKKYMRHKPRRRDESIISKSMAVQICIMGGWLTALSIAWFKLPFMTKFFSESELYSGFFTMFVFAFMVNAFNVRTDGFNVFKNLSKNKNFVRIWLLIIVIQVLLVVVPGIGRIFSCENFGWQGWLIVAAFALTMYPIDLIRKGITWLVFKKKGEI